MRKILLSHPLCSLSFMVYALPDFLVEWKGGSGRTSLMAAIILCARGMNHDQILDQVKALCPNALKLAAHTGYLQQACAALGGRRSAEV